MIDQFLRCRSLGSSECCITIRGAHPRGDPILFLIDANFQLFRPFLRLHQALFQIVILLLNLGALRLQI